GEAHRVEPASRRPDRPPLSQSRPAAPRPDRGGEPRAAARRRQVRCWARRALLDLRDVVGAPGDRAGAGEPGADDPSACARRAAARALRARGEAAEPDPRARAADRGRGPAEASRAPGRTRRGRVGSLLTDARYPRGTGRPPARGLAPEKNERQKPTGTMRGSEPKSVSASKPCARRKPKL